MTGGGGVRKRGAIWWLYYQAHGKQIHESSGTADKRAAQSLLAQRRRELRDGTWRAPAERSARERVEAAQRELAAALAACPEAAPLTVRVYLERWLERRERAGIRTVRDERARFATHVYPRLGDVPLSDVKRTHIRALVDAVKEYVSPVTGRRLASRTVLHVYRTLATALAEAVSDELIPASPCSLRTRRAELPEKRDADPTWRRASVYTRAELVVLLTDERIPEDRRVYYALGFLAGLRAGEIAGRRWRDVDEDATPLGRLTVASQADSKTGHRPRKTGDVVEVPIVPALGRILARWRTEGFPRLYLRSPQPDDLIVPSRSDGRSPRSKRTLERMREDLERVGLRRVPSPRHAMRATFLTMLEIAGANMAIARRATHAAPKDVVGGYTRIGWPALCSEVAKLDLPELA